jgi:arylsulfotransferase ASST
MLPMLRIFILFTLLLALPFAVSAQILPKEGSELNYRLVGFSFLAGNSTVSYSLEIASGIYYSQDSFGKNIIKKYRTKTNRIVGEVPSFGSHYTWRVIYNSANNTHAKTDLFHFSTGSVPEVDTTNVRFRILEPPSKHSDAYVFLDGNRALYDMYGHPVWYVPQIDGKKGATTDLKLSSSGTITFLNESRGYEINYNGDILWNTPAGATVSAENNERYHHEFTRLSNGHYMILGNELLSGKVIAKGEGKHMVFGKGIVTDSAGPRYEIPFGTIIEYDKNGNVVWLWKSAKYYEESDLSDFVPGNNPVFDMHENAFFFNEKEQVIYISFKYISRIIKIKYPEGTVLNTYGEINRPGISVAENGFFCQQHACKQSTNGCFFVFNNNDCGDGPPKLKKLKEPSNKNDNLKKIWEYQCTVESGDGKKMLKGGNVVELHDQSVFACMGSDYSKTFIVDPGKKVLWSGLPEKWDELGKEWVPIPQYRASIIESRAELEKLVWNAENNALPATEQVSFTNNKKLKSGGAPKHLH